METKVMVGPPFPFNPPTIRLPHFKRSVISASLSLLCCVMTRNLLTPLIARSASARASPHQCFHWLAAAVSLHGPPFPDVFMFVIAAIFQPCALVSSASSVLIWVRNWSGKNAVAQWCDDRRWVHPHGYSNSKEGCWQNGMI